MLMPAMPEQPATEPATRPPTPEDLGPEIVPPSMQLFLDGAERAMLTIASIAEGTDPQAVLHRLIREHLSTSGVRPAPERRNCTPFTDRYLR